MQDEYCISYTQLYNSPVAGMNRKQMDAVSHQDAHCVICTLLTVIKQIIFIHRSAQDE